MLGAGSMGLQLAAHLANAQLDVVLFDLADNGSDPSQALRSKLAEMAAMQPPALAWPAYIHAIQPATFQHDLAELRHCDLVIETTCEQRDCKEGVLARIAPYLHKYAVITTATDTISIERLALALPEPIRARFCGLHFLLPPRYTHLVELAPASSTHERVLQGLENFTVSVLGKQVVRVKDSPLFIADRTAVFVCACALHHAQRFELALETVDALFTRTLGMPEDGLFGAIDRLGARRFMRLVEEARTTLVDDDYLQRAQWPQSLLQIDREPVFYRPAQQASQQWLTLDLTSGEYTPCLSDPLREYSILNENEWLKFVSTAEAPQAQFLRAVLADFCCYAATHVETMSHSCADLDLALRCAFGLKQGIFELWQQLGWSAVPSWNKSNNWPKWIHDCTAVYNRKGVYIPAEKSFKPLHCSASLKHQLSITQSSTVKQLGDGLECSVLHDQIYAINIVKATVLFDSSLLNTVQQLLNEAQSQHKAILLVLRGCDRPQSPAAIRIDPEDWLQQIAQLFLQIYNARVPVVCTLNGHISKPMLSLALACSQRIASLNTWLHTGARGLSIPAVSGVVTRLQQQLFATPSPIAQQVTTACYSAALLANQLNVSAARHYGIFPQSDIVLLNPADLTLRALTQLRLLIDHHYQPPPHWSLPVLGRESIDTVRSLLHDQFSADQLDPQAKPWEAPLIGLFCGGDRQSGELISMADMLQLEQDCYLQLWNEYDNIKK